MKFLLAPVLVTLGLSGCALMDRGEDFSYAGADERPVPNREFKGLSEELNPSQAQALEHEARMARMEKSLPSKDRQAYQSYRSSFRSAKEQDEYLSLPSAEARERYATLKEYEKTAARYSPKVNDAVSRNDIVLGMPRNAVLESWGQPEVVEVAGNARYGNERWRYTEVVSTPDGFQEENRVVIFENGRVAGWYRE